MSYSISYSRIADKQIDNIFKHIAFFLLSPITAQKQIARIRDAISKLDEMPNRNPLIAEEPWKSKGIRKLIVDNFIVFYVVNEEEKKVTIVLIAYAGQNISENLKNLEKC